MADPDEYESIRLRAAAARAQAVTLRDAVQASHFKKRLAVVIADIDDIDSIVLPQAQTVSRPTSKVLWRDIAMLRLRSAEDEISSIQAAVDKFGYDAEVMGAD